MRELLAGEPVATRMGPAVALVAAYLFARGVIDASTADLIAGLVAILGGGGVLALARAKVAPWPPRPEAKGKHRLPEGDG
jgi:hypothetical protein